MTQDLPEKPAEKHPFEGRAADSEPPMNHASHGLRFDPQDLRNPHVAIEALAHWDELDPSSLAFLEKHPVHGPRLAMLRAADAWLADSARAARALRESTNVRPAVAERDTNRALFADESPFADERAGCPRADDLYDYGRGPGYAPLAPSVRASIDRHLARCRRCETLVETLSAPPPAPLEIDDDAASIAVGEHAHDDVELDTPPAHMRIRLVGDAAARDTRNSSAHRAPEYASANSGVDDAIPTRDLASNTLRPVTRERDDALSAAPVRTRRWIPIAVAASLIAGASMWFAWSAAEQQALRFPESPLLRGATSGSLLFPREHVLLATPELVRIWPSLGEKLAFEIQPEPAAQSYWMELSKHDGSAFGANESVWKQSSAAPTIAARSTLAAGHYTWEAWAIVHGLDQQLGRRDFDVVDDAALRTKLIALAQESEPRRSLAAVRLLHENGYRTDARRIARAMPASPERDEYLARVPGR
jgi:hypothetical protein